MTHLFPISNPKMRRISAFVLLFVALLALTLTVAADKEKRSEVVIERAKGWYWVGSRKSVEKTAFGVDKALGLVSRTSVVDIDLECEGKRTGIVGLGKAKAWVGMVSGLVVVPEHWLTNLWPPCPTWKLNST